MGVWQGTANSISIVIYYIRLNASVENGFAFCPMSCSILTMVCLSMQQGMFAFYQFTYCYGNIVIMPFVVITTHYR